MTRIAYFDCFSGCSGDMVLGALLDAGLELQILREGLSQLGLTGYQIDAEKVKRASITATKFNVSVDDNLRHHRGLTDILEIIESSQLSAIVKEKSSAIFQRLGEVEAEIHGVSPDEIHFHELGAVDSIIDIVGTIFALEALQIEHLYSSAMLVGSGTVATAHGILPVPAPATMRLLADAGVPLTTFPESGTPAGELVTPTGAVLITSLSSFTRPAMNIEKVGYGAGSKDFENWPNVLRIWLGEADEAAGRDGLVLLETNIDDMNPQIFGYLMETLFQKEALDVWFTPIQMKKNRPAVMLSVLAPSQAEASLTEIIMKETSTLGVRSRPISRHTANRESVSIESSLGHIQVKVKRFMGDVVGISPEYEECRRIALEQNKPLQEVLAIVEEEARQYFSAHPLT